MILSMTGFAAVAAELPGVSLTVDLRSVNHRYLDLSIRLPDELRALESALRERISAELRRGKVECRIALNRSAPGSTPLSVAEILRWPGVLTEPSVAPEALAAQAHALVGTALRELAASRAREGAKLVAMLEERCSAIEVQVARVA